MNTAEFEARKRANKAFGDDLVSRLHKSLDAGAPFTDSMAVDFKKFKAEEETLAAEEKNHLNTQEMALKMGGNFADANRASAPAPFISAADLKALHRAAEARQPLRVETKSGPFATTGFASGGIPAVLRPDLTMALPYEPTRAFVHFAQQTAPNAGSVAFIQHTANGAPAAAVAELGAKPDISPAFTEQVQSFVKVAGICSLSTEALQDFDYFQTFVPAELQRAIADAENNEVINGSGSGAHMRGLLNVSGTLTRSQGSDTPLDALRKAIADLRVGSSYAKAGLIILHPTTLSDLELQKSTTGQYLLNPNDPNSLGDTSNIFGVPVVSTTTIAAGTAIVCDPTTIYAWTRQAIQIDINPFGGDSSTASYWQNNVVGFRAEERVAIGATRPTAINIVTGLPS